jgi:hypothetical protein
VCEAAERLAVVCEAAERLAVVCEAAKRLDAGEPPTSTFTLSRSLTSRFSRVRPSRLRRAPAQATMRLRAKE